MNKLLILLFALSVISCHNKSKLLKNGLTKKATHITEYTIDVKRKNQDTLFITEKKYNENDQITHMKQRYSFSNDTVNTKYHYNKNQKLEKEIVHYTSNNTTFTVNYFYNDTLLIGTRSGHKDDEMQFKYIGKYRYTSENKLKESSLAQLYIDMETNDTITNTLEVKNYDEKQLVTTSKLSDYVTPTQSKHYTFTYDDDEMIIEIKEYDAKNSLISTIKNTYEFDQFDNWIKRESSQNGRLDHILTREIIYK